MRNGEDPKLKFNAIESILDRCGVGKNTNIAPSMHISVERMDVIVQALQESSLVSNPTAPLFSPPAVEPTGE
jgi:hypothetical protein